VLRNVIGYREELRPFACIWYNVSLGATAPVTTNVTLTLSPMLCPRRSRRRYTRLSQPHGIETGVRLHCEGALHTVRVNNSIAPVLHYLRHPLAENYFFACYSSLFF